jgi:FAD synthase
VKETWPLVKPIYIHGLVTKGFGRGSALLGMPTANLPADDYNEELLHIDTGVFIGWANVNGGPVYKTVLGIGDNPQFGDCLHRTIEPHLLHEFEKDFYGQELRLVICGYVRAYDKFESLEKLKEIMNNDKKIAENALDVDPYVNYKNDEFFQNGTNEPNCNSIAEDD